MPKKKRKKYPKLPAGFGSIRYLGSGRRNCYAVHPPARIDALGNVLRPAAICYTDDWIKGFTVLTAYKAGTYQPGMEKELETVFTSDADILVQRIIADYTTIKGIEDKHPEIHQPTFAEVFEDFYKWKFENPRHKPLSWQARNNYRVAFNNCSVLHDRPFISIKTPELQKVLDDCPLGYSSLNLIQTLFSQIYKYAIAEEICEVNKAALVHINSVDDTEHGVPFTLEEINRLWERSDDEDAQMVLIMIYSGFRISEFKVIDVNLEEKYFHGGLKNKTSKTRFVPIHSAIYSFVESRIRKYGSLIPGDVKAYRESGFYPLMRRLDMVGDPKHTPHDCRHTFSMLCEKYNVKENDRKRMLGHSFRDITNAVYGHRDLEDLREEIEKIPASFRATDL